MELKTAVVKARFVNGVAAFEMTDPPKIAERTGEPPVTVDPPGPQSVAYGIRKGSAWEVGAGVLHTKHGQKRSDGTRVVIEDLERGSVLKSSQDNDAKLRLEDGDVLQVFTVAGDEFPMAVIVEELSKALAFVPPTPVPSEADTAEIPVLAPQESPQE